MRTISALLVLTFAGTASAADFPRYAPVGPAAVTPAPLWSGPYIGGHIGGGWATARSDFSTTGPAFGTADNRLAGIAGGLQLGYNWQSRHWVYGAEADFSITNMDGSLATSCPAALCGIALAATYDQKMPWFGTVRGRLGYAQDGWLIYVTGGYAYTRLQTEATASAGAGTALSQHTFRNGWTAGGGIEVALTRQWSLKTEYLYMDFGSHTTTWTVPGLPALTDATKLNMNLVRAGVNYRF